MMQLRRFDKSDYDTLISWIADAEMLMQFAGPNFTFPLTPQQLDSVVADEKRFSFVVMDGVSGVSLGHSEIHLTKTSALLGRIIIGEAKWRGKGLGEQIVNQLLKIAFIELSHNIAELNVFDWNAGAIRSYEKCGFTINPNKKYTRDINGKTWTAINMILAKDAWLKRHLQITNPNS